MAYPLIILGAGASYDYSAYTKRPPLTKDLVNPDYFNRGFLDKYNGAARLLSEIAVLMNQRNETFEGGLHVIKEAAGDTDHRRAQFVDLQFYLRDLFNVISSDLFYPVNSYQTLLSKIYDSGGKACVISFNYDTLFEQSIGKDFFNDIDSYIKGAIKLIKLHGSHDWAYIGKAENLDLEWRGFKDHYEYFRANPNYLDQLRQRGVHPYHVKQLVGRQVLHFPAIAIPLPDKQDFLCPPAHLQVLERELSKIDKILVIGWGAGDPALVELMEQVISQPVKIAIVAGKESLSEIQQRLSKLKNAEFSMLFAGFNDFMGSKECSTFFGV